MSYQYERILRLKPIIEANRELMERFKACFDYVEAYGNWDSIPWAKREKDNIKEPDVIGELVTDGDNTNRFIFKGFQPVMDPKPGKNEYFIIKTPIPGNRMGLSYRFEKLIEFDRGLGRILSELGSLDGSFNVNDIPFPSVLGLVIDRRYNNAALLMSDYTRGGKYRIKSDDNGETIEIFHGKKKIGSGYGDMKRSAGGYSMGKKYFDSKARIELPIF